MKLQILNPAGTCVLYEEVQSGIDLSASKGAFSLGVGSAASDTKRSANFRGAYNPSMISVFRNGATLTGIPAADCAAGTYVAGASDTRLLRVHVTKGSTTETLSPDLVINTVPSAQVAASLQGFLPSDFLRLDVANGISGNIGLTATGTGAGQTREFRFYELAANGVEYSAFKAPDAMATSLTYVLPSGAPAAGDVLKATVPSSGVVTLSWGADAGAGGGISNFNGSNQSSQSFTAVDIAAAVTAPAWSTNIGTGAHTLQIPMAAGAGVTGGLITKTEHTAFSSKVDRAGDTMTGSLLFSGTAGISVGGTGTIAMGTNKITGVGDPTNAQEAATKAYVDSQNSGKIGGTLTATRIPYASGASTLTDSANFTYTTATGAMTIGGTAPSINSNDAITIAAGGTNKNVVLTPTGTGRVMVNGAADAASYYVNGIQTLSTSSSHLIVHSAATKDIAFWPSGTEAMRIASGGNVGIGTSTPASRLHVGAAPTASTNYGLLSLGSAPFDGATAGFFTGHASGTVLGSNAASGFAGDLVNLQVAGVQKFKVDKDGKIYGDGSTLSNVSGALSGLTAGRVPFATAATTLGDDANLFWNNTTKRLGVGTITPATALNVVGGDLQVEGANNGEIKLFNASGNGMFLRQYSASQNSLMLSDGSLTLDIDGNTNETTAALKITKDGTSTELMRVQEDGKVGIGTATPFGKLDVRAGAANLYSNLENTSTGHDVASVYADGTHSFYTGLMGGTFSTTGVFSISYGGNVGQSINLTSTGKVGIGMKNPSHLLDVGDGTGQKSIRVYSGHSIAGDNSPVLSLFSSGNREAVLAVSGNKLMIGNTNGLANYQNATIAAAANLTIDIIGNVGIGTTEPASKLHVGVAPSATANYGLISLGSGFFDGATAGFFTGHASGTLLAANVAGAFAGDLINLQAAGVQKFKVDKDGKIYGDGSTLSNVSGAISGLTAGRVPYSASATTIADSADFTFSAAGKKIVVNSINIGKPGSNSSSVFVGASPSATHPYGGSAALGFGALGSLTAGEENTAVGNNAGSQIAGGSQNTAVGNAALLYPSAGSYNTAVGVSAALGHGGGNSWNVVGLTAIGAYALQNAEGSANYSAALGLEALQFLSTGAKNVAVGYRAGVSATPANALTTGSNNVFLGVESGLASTTQRSNSVAIGYRALVDADNAIVLGTSTTKVGIGTTNPTSRLTVPWISGDAVTTASFGSSNVANDQVAVTGTSYAHSGVYGQTTTGFAGVYGLSNGAGAGTIGVGTGLGTGVLGGSSGGMSGFFQSLSSLNANPTLVIQRNSTATGDMFQVQNAAGTPIFKIAADGKLQLALAPTATANLGLVSLGSGPFDGATAGFFVGDADGTVLAANAASGYTGNLADLQVAGSSKFKVTETGAVTATSFSGDGSGLTGVSAGITVASLVLSAGANNDVALNAGSYHKVSGPGAAFVITGIAGGTSGKTITLENTVASVMVIAIGNGGSTAANRIMGQGCNVTQYGAVTLAYNTTTSRWIVTSCVVGSGAAKTFAGLTASVTWDDGNGPLVTNGADVVIIPITSGSNHVGSLYCIAIGTGNANLLPFVGETLTVIWNSNSGGSGSPTLTVYPSTCTAPGVAIRTGGGNIAGSASATPTIATFVYDGTVWNLTTLSQ